MAARDFRAGLNRALAWIYPDVCQICRARRATGGEGYVCAHCRKGVRFVKPPFCDRCSQPFAGDLTTPFACANCRGLDLQFDFARSAVLAQGVVLEVIHRYKYRRHRWLEPFLADLFLQRAAPALDPAEWNVLVPVPLSPVRQREREFNQAHALAAHLSRATGIPMNAQGLRRVRATRTQALLKREARWDNMRDAFALDGCGSWEGRSCVVVDDVLTTGATTSACARALKVAGARRVCVWTLARGV